MKNKLFEQKNRVLTMRYCRKHILVILMGILAGFVSLPVSDVNAQTEDGGTINLLHEVGAGARAYALGRAYVALANDPTGVYWNPAGLEFVPRMAFTLFRRPLAISGASYDFLGFVYPTLNLGTVGIGYARVGVGEIPTVNEANVVTGEGASFDNSEIYISYAKKIPLGLTPGITFKVNRQSFSATNQVSSAFGLDLGLMYRPGGDAGFLKDFSLGFHVQNIVRPQLKLGANQDSLSNKMSFGLMKGFQVGLTGKFNILFDYVKGQYESGAIHAGGEYVFQNLGTIRVGYDRNAPSFGAGIEYKFVNIDYSFSNLAEDAAFSGSAVHRFSITFNLGKSRAEKILIADEERRKRETELVERTKEGERQRRVADHMTKGKEFYDQEHYFDAYSEFQQVITDDPFNKTAKAYFDSSRARIQDQFDTQKEEAIAQAVDKSLAEENQKQAQLHFDKGQVYLQKKQFTDALKEFNSALEFGGDPNLINDAINTTNRRKNEEVKSLVTDGRAEFQKGNYSDALRILSEAMVLSPESDALTNEIETLQNRIKLQQYIIDGLAYMRASQYQEALNIFEEALKLDPTNEAIKKYYDQTKIELGTKREKMDPESERRYIDGTELFLAGQYQEALAIWKELAEKYPLNKKLQDAIKTAEERIERTQGN